MTQRFFRGVQAVGSILGLVALGALFVFLTREPSSTPIKADVYHGFRVTNDVVYGEVDGVTLRMDIYQPDKRTDGPFPAVLLIHGGGWVQGDKSNEAAEASQLVPKGFVAFAVQYRLAKSDQTRYPAAVLDVQRAARWVRTHAQDYGADPGRVAAAGFSAGGHLAMILGTSDVTDAADPNSPVASSRVDCVVDTSGPVDLTDDANPPLVPALGSLATQFFGKPRDQMPQAYRDASPALHVDRKTVPTLVVHGDVDDIVPVEQSRHFAKVLAAAGVKHEFIEVHGEGHGFLQPENFQRWIDETARFLTEHLKPNPAG